MNKNILLTLLLALSIANPITARGGSGGSRGGSGSSFSHGRSAGFSGAHSAGISRTRISGTGIAPSAGVTTRSAGVTRSGRTRSGAVTRTGTRSGNWSGRSWNRNRYWGWNNGVWGWVYADPFLYWNTFPYDDIYALQREIARLQYELDRARDPDVIDNLQAQINELRWRIDNR